MTETKWDRERNKVRQKLTESERQRWSNEAWKKDKDNGGQEYNIGHSSLVEVVAQGHYGLGVRNSNSHSHPKLSFLKIKAELKLFTFSLHSFRRAPSQRGPAQLTPHSWAKSSD